MRYSEDRFCPILLTNLSSDARLQTFIIILIISFKIKITYSSLSFLHSFRCFLNEHVNLGNIYSVWYIGQENGIRKNVSK